MTVRFLVIFFTSSSLSPLQFALLNAIKGLQIVTNAGKLNGKAKRMWPAFEINWSRNENQLKELYNSLAWLAWLTNYLINTRS